MASVRRRRETFFRFFDLEMILKHPERFPERLKTINNCRRLLLVCLGPVRPGWVSGRRRRGRL